MTRRPTRAEDLLQVLRSDLAVSDLREYFNLDRPLDPPLYSGARYDALDNGGARQEVKDIITPSDILAIQCLSVVVPPPTVLTLIEGQLGVQLTACLRDIPADIDLGDLGALDHLRPRSAADRAWRLHRAPIARRWRSR